MAELAQLASESSTPYGRVKIPGFYDDVEKLTKEQLQDFKAARLQHPALQAGHEFKSIRTNDPLDA